MPDIFDSSVRNEDPESLDHQRRLLRGVRTRRGAGRRSHKTEVNMESPTTDQSPTSQAAAAAHDEFYHHHRKRSVDEYSDVMRHERPATNPLLAYAAKPLKTFFASQHSDEDIILVLRKHPITQLRWILTAILLALAPFLFESVNLVGFLEGRYQFAALLLWYLFLTGYIFESFLTWFFNVYIVTDERIIDVDFLSLIYRNISTAKIDNIEDVTATTGGAIRAMFDFGTVSIQTAAEKREFEFEDVPHPNRVTKLLNELILEEEREKIEGRVS